MSSGELFDPMTADPVTLMDHVHEVADDPRIWPTSLAELVDVLADDLKEQGMDETDAFASARRSVALISWLWGGRMRYLPKNEKLRLALRDSQIWRKFCASRSRQAITELAVEYDLSDQQVYSIVRVQKKLTIKRVQGDLFTDSEN